jgi:protein-tyrosine-phosphatase
MHISSAGTQAHEDSAIGTYAARMRGSARGSAEQDAMSDPYGRGDSACMAALDQIEQSVDEVVRVLASDSPARKS